MMPLLAVFVLLASAGATIWRFTRRRDGSLAQRAALILDELSDAGFVVLHGVRLGGRNLDYVVCGPPGVTVVRTENGSDARHRKQPQDRVFEALKELHEDVSCLGSRIEAQVAPLLVTSRELDFEIPNGGELVAVARLEEHLRGQPERLDESTVSETVVEVLRATTSSSAAVEETTKRQDVDSA